MIIHYTNLAVFFWTNVMAWDIYKTFGQRTILSHIRNTSIHFPRYIAYGFGVPLIIVLFCITIDVSDFIPSFSMGYGKAGLCWINDKPATLVFFCLPMLFVCISNSILYGLTVTSINYVSSLTQSDNKHGDRGRSDLFIYIRIFVILGITWVFGIIGIMGKKDETPTKRAVVMCFVVTDSLQGFFLFWVFTFNKRVQGLYCRLLARLGASLAHRMEERERLNLRASMMRERGYSRSSSTRFHPVFMMPWQGLRTRKSSSESQASTSTANTGIGALMDRLEEDSSWQAEQQVVKAPELKRISSWPA